MDYINKQKPSQKEKSQQEEDRASIAKMEQKYEEKKNAIIARLCNTPNPSTLANSQSTPSHL